MTEIVVALISLLGSGCGALVGIIVQSKIINYRIEQLERRVGEHNNLIVRTYEAEKQLQKFGFVEIFDLIHDNTSP